jgi:hypothetical protein
VPGVLIVRVRENLDFANTAQLKGTFSLLALVWNILQSSPARRAATQTRAVRRAPKPPERGASARARPRACVPHGRRGELRRVVRALAQLTAFPLTLATYRAVQIFYELLETYKVRSTIHAHT